MKLSKAIEGYLVMMGADGYSPGTIVLYRGITRVMLDFLGDVEIEEISPQDLRRYIYFVRNDYRPRRFSKDPHPLYPSAVDNYWKCMRSFFGFYDREYHTGWPDRDVRRPTYENPEVKPFSPNVIVDIIKAATTLDYKPLKKRVGELCRMLVQDIRPALPQAAHGGLGDEAAGLAAGHLYHLMR